MPRVGVRFSASVLAEYKEGNGPRRLSVVKSLSFPGAVIEVGKDSGASSDLVPVNIDYHAEEIIRGASLSVRPPAECGACLMHYEP